MAVPPYMRLIQNDPAFHQQTLNLSAQGIQDEASRSAQTRSALARFGDVGDVRGGLASLGLDPASALYRNLLGDVDAAQPAAAGLTSGGLSTVAGLGRDHQVQLDALRSRNAGRGSVRSGATGIGLENEALRFSGAQFGARNDILDYLAGVQAAFAQSERGRQDQLATGAAAAATRQGALYPTVPTPRKPPALRSTLIPRLNLGGQAARNSY